MTPPFRGGIGCAPGRLKMTPDGKFFRPISTIKERREFAARSRDRKATPPAMPDWGLEPAASSWIRLRLPLHPRDEPHLPLHPREEREPKPRSDVDGESPKIVTLMIWDLPNDVNCDELRKLLEGVDGIIGVFYSSFRHLMLVDFLTSKALHKARDIITSRRLRYYCPLKIAFFLNSKYFLNRDMSSFCDKPGSLNCTVCIEGFDSFLHVEQIRTMLARHFGSNHEGTTIPTNSDGSSIGIAYIKYRSWSYISEALILNGTYLEGHKLHVTECPGVDRSWDGRITQNMHGTGKRIVFNDDSDSD
ncbi:hypothetical protein ACP70R_006789 [Stipagrostis hirtigluma subsp. patula]